MVRLRPESDPPLHQAAPPANVDLKSMVRLRRESDPPLHQAAPPANMDLESMVRLRPESDPPTPAVDSTAPRRLPRSSTIAPRLCMGP